MCKYVDSINGCVRKSAFMFLHEKRNQVMDKVKKNSQKCDACRFESFNKGQVKIHKVKKQKFLLCMKCDQMLEHKEILTTKTLT